MKRPSGLPSPLTPGSGPAEGQIRVVLDGTGKGHGRVYVNGVQLDHVRMVDVATTASINDVVRSRISIELVGEVIAVEYLPPPPPPEERDSEAPHDP